MTAFPVEQFQKEQLAGRLLYAMIEALFRQGLLSEAQRDALCVALRCENAAFPEQDDTIGKNGIRRKPR